MNLIDNDYDPLTKTFTRIKRIGDKNKRPFIARNKKVK